MVCGVPCSVAGSRSRPRSYSVLGHLRVVCAGKETLHRDRQAPGVGRFRSGESDHAVAAAEAAVHPAAEARGTREGAHPAPCAWVPCPSGTSALSLYLLPPNPRRLASSFHANLAALTLAFGLNLQPVPPFRLFGPFCPWPAEILNIKLKTCEFGPLSCPFKPEFKKWPGQAPWGVRRVLALCFHTVRGFPSPGSSQAHSWGVQGGFVEEGELSAASRVPSAAVLPLASARKVGVAWFWHGWAGRCGQCLPMRETIGNVSCEQEESTISHMW